MNNSHAGYINNGYSTYLDNRIMLDRELSIKSKGIYALLCICRNEESFSLQKLSEKTSTGYASLRSSLKELMKFGYLMIDQERNNGKFSGSKWVLNDFDRFPNVYIDSNSFKHEMNQLVIEYGSFLQDGRQFDIHEEKISFYSAQTGKIHNLYFDQKGLRELKEIILKNSTKFLSKSAIKFLKS